MRVHGRSVSAGLRRATNVSAATGARGAPGAVAARSETSAGSAAFRAFASHSLSKYLCPPTNAGRRPSADPQTTVTVVPLVATDRAPFGLNSLPEPRVHCW